MNLQDKYVNPFTDFGFKKLFGSEPNFTKAERLDYEDSLKYYRDIKNVVNTSYLEGREEREIEIARNLLSLGVSIENIEKATGLSKE